MRGKHPTWVTLANGARVTTDLADMPVRVLSPRREHLATYGTAIGLFQTKVRHGQSINDYDLVDARSGRYVSWFINT